MDFAISDNVVTLIISAENKQELDYTIKVRRGLALVEIPDEFRKDDVSTDYLKTGQKDINLISQITQRDIIDSVLTLYKQKNK